jgi:hypothetical protein
VKVTPTTSYGSLSISSSPTDAEAYVDNVFRGYTPLTLTDIQPGSHTITLRLAGYQNWQGTVQVNGGQTTTVQGILGAVPTTTSTKLPGFGIAVVMVSLAILGGAVYSRRD